MDKRKFKILESPPLSDIELNDVKLSEKEYARGEALTFGSVEEMLAYINIVPKEEE